MEFVEDGVTSQLRNAKYGRNDFSRRTHLKQLDIKVSEQRARKIVLARAIEDTNELIGVNEREDLDKRAADAARAATGSDGTIKVEAVLGQRAEFLLEMVGKSNRVLASLQNIPSWRQWLVWGLPLAALIFGIATDRIVNPHRVDLISLPLLFVVVWNIFAYAFFLLALFKPGFVPLSLPVNPLWQWIAGISRVSPVSADAAARFFMEWGVATAALGGQRVKQVLHFSAAALGAGIGLSLLFRGLNTEYRTGWESTILSADGVLWVVNILFMPVVACFPLEPFTLEEINRLKFVGADGGAAYGSHWMYLYIGTLLLYVVLPRLGLASIAWWRVQSLSRQVIIDLSDEYFQRLIDQLIPARVRLCVYAHRESDLSAIKVVLARESRNSVAEILIENSNDDALLMATMSQEVTPPVPEVLWRRLLPIFRRPDRGRVEGSDGDVLLHVVGRADDLVSVMPLLSRMGMPVLVLVNSQDQESEAALLKECLLHKKHHETIRDVLSFNSFARCWVQEPALWEAVSRCVPRSKRLGFERLAGAWGDRNIARFKEAVSILAVEMLYAARETEVIHSEPISAKDIISSELRDVHERAVEVARDAVVERLRDSTESTVKLLRKLHFIDCDDNAPSELESEAGFDIRWTFNKPQSAAAGAVAGAGVGAAVDMAMGGLTLGISTALGALIGGGGAWLAAKRTSSTGGGTVQLSDEMLQTLIGMALLRYLAIVHFNRDSTAGDIGSVLPSWGSEVASAVKARRKELLYIWTVAREPGNSEEPKLMLEAELGAIARNVLRTLYPEARGLYVEQAFPPRMLASPEIRPAT